jgi:Raf kinase inhibitor-like YbhB/YbcL family protein
MKTRSLLALIVVSGAAIGTMTAQEKKGPPRPQFRLTTSAWSDGGQIPVKNGCSAQPSGVSPALEWANIPDNTATFVLIMHDSDVAMRRGVDDVLHWMLWNIPAATHQLPEAVPANAQLADGTQQGKNVRGANAYQPPCPPPPTTHHYSIELFALDQKLNLPAEASRADVLKAMDGHVLGKSVYVGLFHQ